MSNPIYDIVIIGSGMAGLYAAYQIQKLSPKKSFLILEKYKKHWIGGRTSNDEFYGAQIVTGAGIGREDTNPLLIDLMKELHIAYKKTTSVMDYSPTLCNPVSPITIIELLRKNYKTCSAYHDKPFKEYAEKILGEELYHTFKVSAGYTDYENADICETLYHYGMDDNEGGWPLLLIPWKKLVLKLANHIGWEHFNFSRNVVEIKKENKNMNNIYGVVCENGARYYTNKVILATTIQGINKILFPVLSPSSNNIYEQIHGQPFLRLYGKFNKKSTEIMKQRVPNYMIVPGPLQKIIPMNSEKGVYMIAYSDNENALSLKKYLSNTLEHRNYFAKLVEKSIGLPANSLHLIAIKDYYWPIGTHYYDPLKDYRSRKDFLYHAQHPMKDILVVGEVVSRYQGWVEGALESVKDVVTKKWIESY